MKNKKQNTSALMLKERTRQLIPGILTCILILCSQLLSAENRTTIRLNDENIVWSEPGELHLQSSSTPMVNSSIDIQHKDAWVFFDNIKPSVVLANFASKITINGTVLSNGINGRVAIYKNGAVVMAHGSDFLPLTVYKESSFNGDSLKLEIHTYHDELDVFDNSIKSFRLSRGYMATFANNPDGSGYSRVFIAANEDIMIPVMPAELDGSVSFIRVFKYEWVSKSGKAGWNPNDINCTTYYDWNIGGNSSSDVEYAAIRQNAGWPSWSAINRKQNISHLLGFNEPDRPDQANMNFNEMIDIWPAFMNSGLRIGSPAWSNAWGGDGGNLFDFVDKCDELNYRVDFVALHCYWGGKSPQSWYNDLKYIYERTGRPLWITEWNNGANWTTEWWPDSDKTYTDANATKQLNDLKGILQVLDTASFIERYFIYDWVQDCRAMVLDGNLTKAGEYYATDHAPIAYNPAKEVIPQWTYLSPSLTYSYSTSTNRITLEWEDPNGELSSEYKLERKINDADFTELYASNDITRLTYEDTVDIAGMATISYRISTKTKNGDFLPSNEVAYYQTTKEHLVEFGNAKVNNSNWQISLYSQKADVLPIILLGIPSYNNRSILLTQRITNMSTKSFKFKIDPWAYMNEPEIKISEEFPIMAIPAGVYKKGTMTVQAKSATSIKGDWKAITFAEAFETTPVVFCTQTSNYTSFPTSIAVRNVTTTGFEVRLLKEEIITNSISSERIHYLAITPGVGIIGNKRVIVGLTDETVGDIYATHELTYDDTYIDPVVFGNLQTANDDITSNLRFFYSSAQSVKIFKSRERSVNATKVSKDKLGYMAVDLSDNQPLSLRNISKLPNISVYPNPTSNVVYFNFEVPTYVELFDLSGQKKMVALVKKSLDIKALPAGTYTIITRNYAPVKVTKL